MSGVIAYRDVFPKVLELMGQGYLALLPQRIFKAVVMIPVQTVLIGLVWKNIVLKVDKSYGVMPNA